MEFVVEEDAEIFYTLDGSDPRQIGGRPSPRARRYTAPISITEPSVVVKARTRRGDEWSALVEAEWGPGR